jgi:hypothetical protein
MGRVGLVVSLILAGASAAFAQSANTGAIAGRVTDANNGQAIAGVTVVAQGPQGEQAELSDEEGQYTITGLVPGVYSIHFYFGNVKVDRTGVEVFADKKIQVNLPMQTKASTSETYTITEKAPTLDIGSTKNGTTLGKDFINNVPTGVNRNFESVAGVAPGAQSDALGTSFNGTTSAENSYVIDGINVTSIHMSQAASSAIGSGLNLDFVQEVEVITGGYNAEYGRATGGVVNVVTKSGSNEFHGDVAAYYDPGSLRGRQPSVTYAGDSIATEDANLSGDYRLDFFADLGGPIVKDRLWFYVGFEPVFVHTTTTKIVSALRDNCIQSGPNHDGPCMPGQDGFQDFVNGAYATTELYRRNYGANEQGYQWTAKLNLLVTPDHTLELAYYGSPNVDEAVRIRGTPVPSRHLGGGQDAIAHWVSKLFDKKWQVDLSMSYHLEQSEHEYIDPLLEQQGTTEWQTDPVKDTNVSGRQGQGPSLAWFDGNPAVQAGCDKVALGPRGPMFDSRSMLNVTCPVFGYHTGGSDMIENLSADRVGARAMGTNFWKAFGHHQFVYGWDFESNSFTDTRFQTGNGLNVVREDPATGKKTIRTQGWAYLRDPAAGFAAGNILTRPFHLDANGNPVADLSSCDQPSLIPGDATAFCASTRTINHALFVRDSWSILPNLTLNLGLRWERQDLQGIPDYENTIIGDSPLLLNDNFAPRLGVIWDPTNEGKAKVYASFARFYESIPMDINNRAFGAEGYYFTDHALSACADPVHIWDPQTRKLNCGAVVGNELSGGEKSLVEPNIKGMYSDEYTVGGEYEVIEDVALGAYYTHRNLGEVIEDGSVDNTATYYITNPGDKVDASQIQILKDQAQRARDESLHQMQTGNMALAGRYQTLAGELVTFADALPSFANFPRPQRDYDAATLTARKRFSKGWLTQASYTYARTIGNYPGLINAYNGQIDPNITSQFDLPDLLHNRLGALPQDVPHQLKIDGYYTWDLGKSGALVTGASFRAQSGSPRSYLGAHPIYGASESFLLPAGTGGRNDVLTSLDLQLAYVIALSGASKLQLFFSLYNVLDSSAALTRIDDYTYDSANPIVNGTPMDLGHLKTVNGAVARRNEAYGQPANYQAPIFTRFGARFSF